ncbi:hypothetical protein K523DRAFT_325910 [Schizophyllum commune Tattone D]|nr:hypothetical protein K523DRAFT_325910 [Schizophyllum commune Tattone D]
MDWHAATFRDITMLLPVTLGPATSHHIQSCYFPSHSVLLLPVALGPVTTFRVRSRFFLPQAQVGWRRVTVPATRDRVLRPSNAGPPSVRPTLVVGLGPSDAEYQASVCRRRSLCLRPSTLVAWLPTVNAARWARSVQRCWLGSIRPSNAAGWASDCRRCSLGLRPPNAGHWASVRPTLLVVQPQTIAPSSIDGVVIKWVVRGAQSLCGEGGAQTMCWEGGAQVLCGSLEVRKFCAGREGCKFCAGR